LYGDFPPLAAAVKVMLWVGIGLVGLKVKLALRSGEGGAELLIWIMWGFSIPFPPGHFELLF
jgi:hypothetical protein